MTRKNLFKFSIINLIIGILLLALSFFFFHFVTDTGISTVFQKEAGKPFVTMLIGVFATLFVFSSATSALAALVFFDKTNK